MKAYTDLEQSKKLAEILPLESADNVIVSIGYYDGVKSVTMPKETLDILRTPFSDIRKIMPCWSFAALLKIIKYYDIEADDGIIIKRKLCYEPYQITTQKHNDIINACIEMIMKLKENGLI